MLYICESWNKCTVKDCTHKVEHHRSGTCENICTKAKDLRISSKCIPVFKPLTNIRW